MRFESGETIELNVGDKVVARFTQTRFVVDKIDENTGMILMSAEHERINGACEIDAFDVFYERETTL